MWIRCGRAADGNSGPEVAARGTSAPQQPSPELTDSDIRTSRRKSRRTRRLTLPEPLG